MRFEIRTGGAFMILIGLGLLSGSVFLLGLVAGYEMGHQQEGNRQFASVYPLPAPPAAASSPSAGAGPEAVPAASGVGTPEAAASTPAITPGALAPAAAAPAAAASGGVAVAPLPPAPPPVAAAPTPMVAAPAPVAAEPAPVAAVPAPAVPAPAEPAPAEPAPVATAPAAAIASEPVVPAKPPVPSSAAVENSASARGEPEITAPVSQRHRGYSIQIEAVMDRGGADAMVARLRHLGYEGYLVETLIGGETWYRVRIGPFATEAAAQAVEQKLHDQYTGSVSAR